MKREKTFIFLLPILLLVSCTEKGLTPELELPPEGSDTASEKLVEYNFTAKMPEGLEWKDSEAVAIYDGTAIRSFSIKETGGSVTLNGYASAESSSFQAVYPFSAAVVTESVPSVAPVNNNNGANDGPAAVLIGDSITYHWARSENGNPDFFSGNDFVCKGISGETTSGMLLRFNTDVVALSPSRVVILGGTNDIAGNGGREIAPSEICDNIARMASLASNAGIDVYICSLLPCKSYYWNPSVSPAQTIISLNSLLKNLSGEKGYAYVDYYSSLADEEGGLPSQYTSDGVHPNKSGYAVMESILLKSINDHDSVPGSETEPSRKILGLKIPSVQTVGAGNDHDTSAMICSGTAVGDVITFAPAVSYLAIHVPEGVNSVSLKGLAYENVTGDSSAIVLDPSESVFTPGNYRIALLPMNFKTGFKLVYSKDGAISVVKFIPGQDETAFVAGGVSDVTKQTAADAHVWLANPIMNEEQLLAYLNSQDAFASEVARIGADISLTTEWTPVALTGTLDGQGHTISGLDVSASVDAGMFSSISEDAALKNITVEGNVALAASRHPAKAGLVANLYGTMYKVVNRVNVSASSEKGACYLGGLAGLVSDGSLIECENAGTVALEKTSGKGYAGGIAGVVYPAGMVDKCNNAGTIKSSSANMGSIGGIIGLQQGGETKNCGNTGKIMVDAGFSTAAAGGVVGMLQNYSAKTLKLTGCTNEGEILLNAPSIQSVGGVVGSLEEGASDEPGASEVASCSNRSDISVKVGKTALSGGLDGFYLGGIVGRINASNDSAVLNTVKGCVNSGNINAALSDDAGANNAVKAGGICGNTRGQVNISGNENAARSISINVAKAARLLCSVGGIIGEVGDPWESEDAEIALISNINRANILSKTNNTETPAGGLIGYLFGPMRGSGNINLGDVERAASDGSSPDVKSCFAGGFIGMANLSPEHRLPVHFNGDVTVGTIKSIGRAGIFFGGLRSGSRADFKFTNCIVGGHLISPYPGNYDIVMNDDNWDDMNRKGDGGYLWGYVSGNYGLSLDGVRYGDASSYDGAAQ